MDEDEKINTALLILDDMIEGCRNVKGDARLHENAKALASMVIRDCNRARFALMGEVMPGDDTR